MHDSLSVKSLLEKCRQIISEIVTTACKRTTTSHLHATYDVVIAYISGHGYCVCAGPKFESGRHVGEPVRGHW